MTHLKFLLPALALLSGGQFYVQAEEPRDLDKAIAYLTGVGAKWKELAPFEKHFGYFLNRTCIAHSSLSVHFDSEKKEFAIKLTEENSRQKVRSIVSARLAEDLRIIELSETGDVDGRARECDYSIRDGRIDWSRKPKGNPVSGEVRSGYLVGNLPMYLMFFTAPTSTEGVKAPSLRGDGSFVFTLEEAKRDFFLGGKKLTSRSVRLEGTFAYPLDTMEGPLSEDGKVLELRCTEGPAHIREIAADRVGKDLDESLRTLEPYEQAYYNLLMAAKSGDRKAVAAILDFEKLAAEGVEGFAELPSDKQAEVVSSYEKNLLDYFCGQEMQKSLRAQTDLDETMHFALRSTVSGDTARVTLTGRRGETYVLRQIKGGPRDGQWVVQGTEPYKKR